MASQKIKWHKVFDSSGSASDAVPDGRVIKVMAGEKYVCFTGDDQGFYAFDDKCPHQGKPLVHGSCTGDGRILCPFHRYTFDLVTGRGHGLYLQTYPVEIREDGVYVGIEKGFWDFF